jgi:hypothetical protein
MSEAVGPDTGEVLRAFLGSKTAITNIVGSRIGIAILGTAPAIRYTLLTNVTIGGGASTARYQVECWGTEGAPDDGTTDLLARTIISVMRDMNGSIGGATVSGAWADNAMRQDDTTTNRPRHILDIAFTARP